MKSPTSEISNFYSTFSTLSIFEQNDEVLLEVRHLVKYHSEKKPKHPDESQESKPLVLAAYL